MNYDYSDYRDFIDDIPENENLFYIDNDRYNRKDIIHSIRNITRVSLRPPERTDCSV